MKILLMRSLCSSWEMPSRSPLIRSLSRRSLRRLSKLGELPLMASPAKVRVSAPLSRLKLRRSRTAWNLRRALRRFSGGTRRNGVPIFFSKNLGLCPRKQSLWLASGRSGFMRGNTARQRTRSGVKSWQTSCTGPPPQSTDSVGMLNRVTNIALGEGMSNPSV